MKSYGKVEAVRGIDFYVEKGKLLPFLDLMALGSPSLTS